MVGNCFTSLHVLYYHLYSSPQETPTDGCRANLKLVVVDSVYDIAAPLLGEKEVEGKVNAT